MNNSLTESTTIANIYCSNIYLTVLIWTTVSEAETATRHFYARLLNWMTEILLLEIYTNIVINRHVTCCYLTLLFSSSLDFVYFNFCIFYSAFVAVAFDNLHSQKWMNGMNYYQIVYKTPKSRNHARNSTLFKSVNCLARRLGGNKSMYNSANSHKSLSSSK